MTITANDISLRQNSRLILDQVNLEVRAGECVGLIGPNGAGKTSLMRAMMGFNPQATGTCSLWPLKPKARAAKVAWLAQERFVAWDLSVEEVVALGRTARHNWRHQSDEDRAHIDHAIKRLELDAFRNRRFQRLSGGERARVLLARVLAQNTEFIFADEPIDSLDPAQQLRVMALLRALAEDQKGVLLSIHDLGLAARYCTRMILVDRGRIVADGDCDAVLNDQNLTQVFGIKMFRAEQNGPILQPIETVEI